MSGSVLWHVEDAHGARMDIVIDAGHGVWLPPFILHTYETLVHCTELLVVANTEFPPDDARAHDTYPATTSAELQGAYANLYARKT